MPLILSEGMQDRFTAALLNLFLEIVENYVMINTPVRNDGAIILDVNDNLLAICKNTQIATALVAFINASGQR
jgi:hypothetical protein